MLKQKLLEFIKENGRGLRLELNVNSHNTIKEMIANDAGVSAIPESEYDAVIISFAGDISVGNDFYGFIYNDKRQRSNYDNSNISDGKSIVTSKVVSIVEPVSDLLIVTTKHTRYLVI